MLLERAKLLFQMMLVVLITTVVISTQVSLDDVNDLPETQVDTLVNDLLNGGKLEVLPAIGDPEPVDVPLQSPKNQSEQQTQGGLQRPGSSQNLQQGAGVESLPDGFLE